MCAEGLSGAVRAEVAVELPCLADHRFVSHPGAEASPDAARPG